MVERITFLSSPLPVPHQFRCKITNNLNLPCGDCNDLSGAHQGEAEKRVKINLNGSGVSFSIPASNKTTTPTAGPETCSNSFRLLVFQPSISLFYVPFNSLIHAFTIPPAQRHRVPLKTRDESVYSTLMESSHVSQSSASLFLSSIGLDQEAL